MKNLRPTDSSSTYLFLIRHGATDANEQRPYILQGDSIDLSLSAEGVRQARAVGEFLASLPLSAIYSSNLKRAMETAREIARHHRLELETHPELREANVGQWEGLDWATIAARFPEQHAKFVEDPAMNPYFGGESYGDVHRRASAKVIELAQRHPGETIAVVAHNVVNRAILAPILGIDLKLAKDIQQVNTGVNLIKISAEKSKVVMLNALFHLEDVEF
ncbi:MAG TPA: histidine phosphatase family protein [Planctomycetaceae bacterium]|nr:histidine phosphatase family protein [Planctomycetaceae bacterium]